MAKATKKKSSPAPAWKNRIVGYDSLPPEQIIKNDKNWRKHPSFQKKAMSGILDEVGWVQDVIINKTTGRLIDGHMRLELSLSKKEVSVPVKYVELSQEEELLVLATLDPISIYALHDKERLKSLIDCVKPDNQALQDLLEGEARAAKIFEDVDHSLPTYSGPDTVIDPDDDAALTGPYCALPIGFDIGVGPCKFGCTYCFVAGSRAATMFKGKARQRPPDNIKEQVKLASETGKYITIGRCIDPALPELEGALRLLLGEAKNRGVFLIFQTKHPKALLKIVQEEKFPAHDQMVMQCSFSIIDNKFAKHLEPGCPTVEARIAALKETVSEGIDVVLKWSPVFLGYYEGFPEILDEINGVKRVTVSPLRVRRVARKNFWYKTERAMSAALGVGWNLDQYFSVWGRRGGKAFLESGVYDYDPQLFREECLKIKLACSERKVLFSLDGGQYSFQNADLNDGPYCCETPAMKAFGVGYDKESLTALCACNRLRELCVPFLSRPFTSKRAKETAIARLILANDISRGPLAKSLLGNQERPFQT